MPFLFAVEKFLILNEPYFFADRFDESNLCMLGHTIPDIPFPTPPEESKCLLEMRKVIQKEALAFFAGALWRISPF